MSCGQRGLACAPAACARSIGERRVLLGAVWVLRCACWCADVVAWAELLRRSSSAVDPLRLKSRSRSSDDKECTACSCPSQFKRSASIDCRSCPDPGTTSVIHSARSPLAIVLLFADDALNTMGLCRLVSWYLMWPSLGWPCCTRQITHCKVNNLLWNAAPTDPKGLQLGHTWCCAKQQAEGRQDVSRTKPLQWRECPSSQFAIRGPDSQSVLAQTHPKACSEGAFRKGLLLRSCIPLYMSRPENALRTGWHFC